MLFLLKFPTAHFFPVVGSVQQLGHDREEVGVGGGGPLPAEHVLLLAENGREGVQVSTIKYLQN